jgi:hypothetical protein
MHFIGMLIIKAEEPTREDDCVPGESVWKTKFRNENRCFL